MSYPCTIKLQILEFQLVFLFSFIVSVIALSTSFVIIQYIQLCYSSDLQLGSQNSSLQIPFYLLFTPLYNMQLCSNCSFVPTVQLGPLVYKSPRICLYCSLLIK